MKVLTGIIALAIIIFVVVIVGWGGYLMTDGFIQNYDQMSVELKTVISFSVMLMVLGVLFTILGIRSAAKMIVSARLNNRRLEIYSDLMNEYMRLVGKNNIEGDSGFHTKLVMYRNELFLLAGSAVLDAVMEFEKQISTNEPDRIISSGKNMLKSMRHELVLSSSLAEIDFLNSLS